MAQNLLYDKREMGMDAKLFAQTLEARCPYLGLSGDRATALGYPDNRNHCHRHGMAVPLTRDRQVGYCLTGKHDTCSIFLQDQPTDDAPKKPFIWRKWSSRLALILLFVLIVIAALIWWPAPGTSTAEFTGNAASLQKNVATEENARPSLSQEIAAPKASAQSAPFEPSIAINAVNLQPVPTVETAETSNPTPGPKTTAPNAKPAGTGVGGFRIRIYD